MKDMGLFKDCKEKMVQKVNQLLMNEGDLVSSLLSPYLCSKREEEACPAIVSQSDDMCVGGCMMFMSVGNDNRCSNPECKETAITKCKQLPLSQQLGQFVGAKANRRKLEYPTNRGSSVYAGGQQGETYSDFFDGSVFKNNYANDLNTLFVTLHVDGFNPFKGGRPSMALVIVTILNIAPDHRKTSLYL
ncbi:hypothetical protein BDB01DRAFT_214921 [Pilobolus umbonatus]|nr:hypothetical protein BDB01DRAFT_214921 [Pilobolus umbonatus]